MPSICLRGRERGQQVWPVSLVRIVLTALGGRGYLVGPPPIDWVMHTCYHPPTQEQIFNVRIFTGAFHVGYQACQYGHDITCRGLGYLPGPPSHPLTGSCTYVCFFDPLHVGPTFMAISKLNFKHIFEIILNDNFLKLMFACTPSDIDLTLRFKC